MRQALVHAFTEGAMQVLHLPVSATSRANLIHGMGPRGEPRKSPHTADLKISLDLIGQRMHEESDFSLCVLGPLFFSFLSFFLFFLGPSLTLLSSGEGAFLTLLATFTRPPSGLVHPKIQPLELFKRLLPEAWLQTPPVDSFYP